MRRLRLDQREPPPASAYSPVMNTGPASIMPRVVRGVADDDELDRQRPCPRVPSAGEKHLVAFFHPDCAHDDADPPHSTGRY